MHARAKTAIAAVGIVAVTLVGSDAMTYAGTGDSLILGKLNKENKATHIKNTGKGPALSLHAKGSRPALAVDSRARIVKLNADRVDGWNAAGLRNNVRVYTARSSADEAYIRTFELPDFPNGRYLATYSVFLSGAPGSATCTFRSGSSGYAGYSAASSDFYNNALSAADVLVKRSAAWRLECSSDALWRLNQYLPARVTLTRIDKAIDGRLDLARSSSRMPAGPVR